jgi:hypothetical protein
MNRLFDFVSDVVDRLLNTKRTSHEWYMRLPVPHLRICDADGWRNEIPSCMTAFHYWFHVDITEREFMRRFRQCSMAGTTRSDTEKLSFEPFRSEAAPLEGTVIVSVAQQ